MLAGELSAGLHLSVALRQEKPLLQRRAKALGKPCCVRFIMQDSGELQLRLRSGLPANIARKNISFVCDVWRCLLRGRYVSVVLAF